MRTLTAFFDDAAVFPPGSLPLDEAVAAHQEHRTGAHGALVGRFVVAAADLCDLMALTEGLPATSVEVSLTVTKPGAVGVALAVADRLPALAVRAVEVAVPADVPVAAVVPTLNAALQGRPGIEVFVELPRDERRGELIAELSQTAYLAKLRTGGVRAELYPDATELAAAIVATVRAGLPFKATAGLHHAVRNTDPTTGFVQHGFLNVLAAVAAAQSGAGDRQVAEVLASRDGRAIAATVADLSAAAAASARAHFRSIGTCSIDEPVHDLRALKLLDAEPFVHEGIPA